MNDKKTTDTFERVIGFDSHPDTFTAAAVRGTTPAAALIEKTFHKLSMNQLQSWAKKHTTSKDLVVLEASGNSFWVVRQLQAIGREAKVLESCHLGKLKEAHANNDKISAVRIAKAYLAGTAKEVWVPDAKHQEWRDIFHAHRKASKRVTQMKARLLSFLSDNGVRLKRGTRLAQDPQAQENLRQAHPWSARQWQIIDILFGELRHAEQQRHHWRSLIAQEVLANAQLLDIVRLCGVREMVAFALGAFIGDINRFSDPKKLVKYVGLNPAFDDSGETEWSGGIGGHGNKYLRCLLIEGAQAILRCSNTPLAQWGKKLLRRKGEKNLVVAAMARKLTVAVWYLMKGRWTPLEEIDERLCVKIGKIIGRVGEPALKALGKDRDSLRQEAYRILKASSVAAPTSGPKALPPSQDKPSAALPEATIYTLDPNKKFTPKAKGKGLAEEYGLR